jgi:hypothetical protein
MEAGVTHRQQHTATKENVPIRFNRADVAARLILGEMSDLVPPIISLIALCRVFVRGLC